MAVEDGAIIGRLLGQINQKLDQAVIPASLQRESISSVLGLYETSQKSRTTTNVKGAINNRYFYHMSDGPEQEARDSELARHTWTNETSNYLWCNMAYNRELLSTNTLQNANAVFNSWLDGIHFGTVKL